MTYEEFDSFIKEGKKLVILDDLVVDTSLFAVNHPGGRFVLDMNVGRDISKFFHGGYSFEPSKNAPNH